MLLPMRSCPMTPDGIMSIGHGTIGQHETEIRQTHAVFGRYVGTNGMVVSCGWDHGRMNKGIVSLRSSQAGTCGNGGQSLLRMRHGHVGVYQTRVYEVSAPRC